MNIVEVCQLEFDRTYRSIYSRDGRYVIFTKAHSLEVIELEAQSNGQIAKYVLEDEQILTYYPFKVAFFMDYIVLVRILSDGQDRYLKLLRFDFRIGSNKKLEIQFPKVTTNDRLRQRVNNYAGLPQEVCEHFRADFIYFEDQRLGVIFMTDKIVLEDQQLDYQLTDVSDKPRILLEYDMYLHSPFALPYVFNWTDMSNCRIRRFHKGTFRSCHLWILNKYASLQAFNHNIFIMKQFIDSRVLMTSRTKILRKFDYIKSSEIHQHYLVIRHYGQLTLLLNIKTAQIFKVSDDVDTMFRGKYVFTASCTKIINQSQLQVRRIE